MHPIRRSAVVENPTSVGTSGRHDGAIKVLIVDDHVVVREGIRALLERRSGIKVVGEAGTVAEAVQRAAETDPDVVVMDVRLPDGSGVEACREIRSAQPDVKVVMLTSYADEDAIVNSVMAGAAGYLLKDARPDALFEAIDVAYRGGSMLDPSVATKVLTRMRGGPVADPWLSLTAQEREVLERITQGQTNRQIGADLHLSEKTVKHYVSNILDKIGVDNRAAAAVWLVRRKFGVPTQDEN
jgi:two-component system response regulator DevR